MNGSSVPASSKTTTPPASEPGSLESHRHRLLAFGAGRLGVRGSIVAVAAGEDAGDREHDHDQDQSGAAED